MIEEILLGFLSKNLDVPVMTTEPENPGDSYIVIEKTGSGGTDLLPSATVVIQSYGKSLYKAAQLNEKVKAAMQHMTELEEISSVKLNSDYNFTNTQTKQFRYQAVYEIFYFAR